ncbi:MAG: invasion associated locus B family protein [Beijerinckiaceae bacterium]
MNTVSVLRGLKSLALVSTLSLVAGSAMAQQTPRPAAPAPAAAAPAAQAGAAVVNLKGDPNQQGWTKVCGRDPASQRETCYTTRDFVAENDTPVLAVAFYETKLDGNKFERQIRYLLPLTFLLQPGVRTSIDGGQPVAGRYTICVQNGCFAEFVTNDATFARLKSGKQLTIQVQNQAAREVSFVMPLEGFAKGVDGAPIDPRVIEEQQKKMQEELQKRSDEMRRQMQGGAAAPGGTPSPAAPAPAAPAAPNAPRP